MGPTTIAIALGLALLVLVPTRRLSLAGARRGTLAAYFAVLWLTGVFVVIAQGPRILLPLLLLAYLAPFVTLGAGFEALRRRFGGGLGSPVGGAAAPPVKDVTPRDEAPPPT